MSLNVYIFPGGYSEMQGSLYFFIKREIITGTAISYSAAFCSHSLKDSYHGISLSFDVSL